MRLDHRELSAIFVGGFAGAVARAELVEALPRDSGQWPWATFIANLVGTAILGYVSARLSRRRSRGSSLAAPLLTTGFCGALTTFSTMQLEIVRMLADGHGALAAGYVGASLAAGLAMMRAGTGLGRGVRAAV